MSAAAATPVTVALVDDYDVVLAGLARMLDPYRERVAVVEIDANEPVVDLVDIALYDAFAQPETDDEAVQVLVDSPRSRRVVVYTWNFDARLIELACRQGVRGYLSKTLSAAELVAALEAVHAGELVISPAPTPAPVPDGKPRSTGDWPGRDHGLNERESEILALITQGRSNNEIAGLTFLSANTIKSYIRAAYRKIGVGSRTQAVLWGLDHGFLPDHRRIDHWR